MKKIISILGARPQFIKAACVCKKLRAMHGITEKIVHTGQHYDDNMSKVFFQELEIPLPEFNLGIGSCTQGAQTGRMVEAIENVLLKEKPHYVIVYGDTNSTLAGALAAVKLHIPIAHIEAGLRSFNRNMPEEINRILTDHTCDLLFAPTNTAVDNLIAEGINSKSIILSGDVMYDSVLHYTKIANEKSQILKILNLKPQEYILATIHRAENTDSTENLKKIFLGLSNIAENINVVLPLHPRTKSALKSEALYGDVSKKIRFIDPVGYLDMIKLEKNARLIVTDSGGIQKEAFFHKIPCVTLRTETEWTELVDNGYNIVVGSELEKIIDKIDQMVTRNFNWDLPLYGDGSASRVITAKIIEKTLSSY